MEGINFLNVFFITALNLIKSVSPILEEKVFFFFFDFLSLFLELSLWPGTRPSRRHGLGRVPRTPAEDLHSPGGSGCILCTAACYQVNPELPRSFVEVWWPRGRAAIFSSLWTRLKPGGPILGFRSVGIEHPWIKASCTWILTAARCLCATLAFPQLPAVWFLGYCDHLSLPLLCPCDLSVSHSGLYIPLILCVYLFSFGQGWLTYRTLIRSSFSFFCFRTISLP